MMTTTHRSGSRLLKSATALTKLLTVSIALLLCTFVSMSAQERPLVISGITDEGISLMFKARGIKYKQRDTIIISYEVENKSKEDIYLVTGEALAPGYDLNKRELSASLYKFILGYDFFELPKIERIRPRKKYQRQVSLSLDFLKDRFSTGNWFLYLSIGYLDNQGMAEIHDQRARFPLGTSPQLFERLQKVIQAGPIRLDLIE